MEENLTSRNNTHSSERREWVESRRYDPTKEHGWIEPSMLEDRQPRQFVHELCTSALIWDGVAQVHSDVIIVATQGMLWNHNRRNPGRAACGIYFGKDNPFNKGYEVILTEDREARTAELVAAIEALRVCLQVVDSDFQYPLRHPQEPDNIKNESPATRHLAGQKRQRDEEIIGYHADDLPDFKRQKSTRGSEQESGDTSDGIKHECLSPRAGVTKSVPQYQDHSVIQNSMPGNPIPPKSQQIRHIIIKTDSEYLVHSMTRYLFQYQVNGWLNLQSHPVCRGDLLRELKALADELNARHVEVLFWLVDPDDNADATELAEGAIQEHSVAEIH
jgi:ribonuclease HI